MIIHYKNSFSICGKLYKYKNIINNFKELHLKHGCFGTILGVPLIVREKNREWNFTQIHCKEMYRLIMLLFNILLNTIYCFPNGKKH